MIWNEIQYKSMPDCLLWRNSKVGHMIYFRLSNECSGDQMLSDVKFVPADWDVCRNKLLSENEQRSIL